MALAIVRLVQDGPQGYQLAADIGGNHFYRYRIGSRKYGTRKRRLGGVVYQSPVMRSQAASPLLSEFRLQVPRSQLGEEGRYLELSSFASERGDGFARSTIVNLRPFTRLSSMQTTTVNPQKEIMSRPTTRREKMNFREIGFAESMSWGALLNVLPGILQAAGPIVSAIAPALGGSAGSPPGPAPVAAAPAQSQAGISPELMAALQALISRIAQPTGTVTAQSLGYSHAAAFSPELLTQLAPMLQRVMSPETLNAIGDQPMKLMRAIGEAALKMDQQEMQHLERINPGVNSSNSLPLLLSMSLRRGNYSRAQIAPALLAALPALMPVVEKLLSPETINALGEQPIKLFKAIGDAALKMDQQEMQHLERINPGVDDPNVLPLLLSMSLPSSTDVAMRYRYNPALELIFAEANTVTIGNVERVIYQAGSEMIFPLLITRTKAKGRGGVMRKALIQLIVQDGNSFEVLMDKKFRIRELPFDKVMEDIRLGGAETDHLPVGRDLKIEINLLWRSKNRRKTYGTFKNHFIRRARAYQFVGAGAVKGAEIPLNDLVLHRPFWHRVWQGGFTESKRWEINFEMKYYYRAAFGGKASALNDTRYRITKDNATEDQAAPHRREVSGQLKSGFAVGLKELQGLLTQQGMAALSPGMLEALMGAETNELFDQVARQSLSFKGKSGQSATLWAYPEVTPRELIFSLLSSPNRFGQFTQEKEEKAVFLIPSSVHLIGTVSK